MTDGEYPSFTVIPDTPIRIKEDLEPSDGGIIRFDVCIEYNLDERWLHAACVHHDKRLGNDKPNIFNDGVSLRYYKNNTPYRASPVAESDKINGRSPEECMDYAYRVLESQASEIIRRFEEWHGIQ